MGRPPSAVTTLPLMEAVPFACAEVSRGGVWGGMVMVDAPRRWRRRAEW